MKRLFGNLLVNIIAAFLFVDEGFWLSLKVAQCQNVSTSGHVPHCYGTRSPKICFTILLNNKSRPARVSYKKASLRCKADSPGSGSSLIVINSQESQRDVERFITSQSLENETIIMDARMLSKTESQTWSWVNGQPYNSSVVSKDVMNTTEQFHDAACVESDREVHYRQLLSYRFENSSLRCRYICEYPGYSYDDNRRYSATDGLDTWYDARKNCLRSRGDLISLIDNQTRKKLPWLRDNQKYWIGLYRNKWIWNSTGAALTYTNWENGFPDESSDKQCICFHPRCRTEYERSRPTCEIHTDRKWTTCNCNNSYAAVCQSEEKLSTPRFTAAITTSINMPTTLTGADTSTSTSPRKKGIPMTTESDGTTSSHDTTKISNRQTALTSPMTQESSNNSFEHKPTEIATHSAELNTTGILIIALLLVVVVIIIVAVILFIRKRKYGRQNDGSPVKNTQQDGAVSCVYATVAADNRPSEDTAPAGNAIYDELDMIQQPLPSNSTIYATVQPTTEAIDMGGSVVYAELDIK